jgi:hypothetical protein
MFAKPFLGALSGHADGVCSLLTHPSSLSTLISGGCDGGMFDLFIFSFLFSFFFFFFSFFEYLIHFFRN